MKKYRALVPVVLLVMLVASWYMLISDAIKTSNEYDHYLSEARKYAEIGVTKYAIENYNKALEIKPSIDIYVEVSDYYESQNKDKELLAWSKDFFEKYPTEPKAYDRLLKTYVSQKDYVSCYDIIYTAQKRNVKSDYISQISSEIAYEYKLDFNSYDDVDVYSNNFCAIKSKDAWGFVDRYGNQRIGAKYITVGQFTKTNLAPVINSQGEVYFIDKSGSKVLVAKEKYKSFGILADNMIAAQKENGKFVYVDQSFSVLNGEYDQATTMNNGVAAVKTGDKWKLINNEGKELTAAQYDLVIVDEKNIAYRNERLFVKNGDKVIMVDSSGKQIGSQVYEDAKVFADTTFAAVKINGKWCFVDKDGKLISNKQYEDARSYLNGMAAVKINGKWGFVDANEDLKIAAEFFETKDFNEKGSCFVKTGDKWQLLKLYRLNREE